MYRFCFILVILCFFTNSCNDKEFEKEYELIKKIIDKPREMQSIIESSDFYSKDYFVLNADSYITYMAYFEYDKEDFIISSNKNFSLYRMGKDFKNCKMVRVYCKGSGYLIEFDFGEVNGKWLLFEIVLVMV